MMEMEMKRMNAHKSFVLSHVSSLTSSLTYKLHSTLALIRRLSKSETKSKPCTCKREIQARELRRNAASLVKIEVEFEEMSIGFV